MPLPASSASSSSRPRRSDSSSVTERRSRATVQPWPRHTHGQPSRPPAPTLIDTGPCRKAACSAVSCTLMASGAVLRVDLDVVVGEVAGPHGGIDAATIQHDAYGDVGFLHHRSALRFGVTRRT